MSDPTGEYPQSELPETASDIVPIKTKLWFGFGSMGESATNWIFNALTFLYYQQILGLSGTLAGTAVLVGIISDAVTDPLMGSISDRFHSRFGRRHPFMFAAPIPLAASVYLIFNPPVSKQTPLPTKVINGKPFSPQSKLINLGELLDALPTA